MPSGISGKAAALAWSQEEKRQGEHSRTGAVLRGALLNPGLSICWHRGLHPAWLWRGCPVHCSISGPYPPDARGALPAETTKRSPDFARCPLGGRVGPDENPWVNQR